jgi:hypothetical protein
MRTPLEHGLMGAVFSSMGALGSISMGAISLSGALGSMGNTDCWRWPGSLMGAVFGSMGALGLMGAVGLLEALGSMGDANCWRWPGGLMEAVVGSMMGAVVGATLGSLMAQLETVTFALDEEATIMVTSYEASVALEEEAIALEALETASWLVI